ncbi:MAG: ORC1-type DNA replication protein [Candidatus Thermoplasmatota archaeon]|nr:ORC1-type DNA replication protein [Candidatus Thermoplasmatota archaeon]
MQTQNIFDEYLAAQPLFNKNQRGVLRPEYVPPSLPHREAEVKQLASIMVTALRGDRPSNILIFGKTGTGKTATVRYIEKEIAALKKREFLEQTKNDSTRLTDEKTSSQGHPAAENANIAPAASLHEHHEPYFEKEISLIEHIYINCEIVDTAYGVLQNIGNRFIHVFENMIPFTGWPLDKVYGELKKNMDTVPRVVIVVLDEIDKLVYKSGDDVLYHLLKLNSDMENAKISIIGISNDLKFTEFLDPRVKSRLGEEKLIFPPYNARQLEDILRERASIAFREGVIDDPAISVCAALGAKEHGDARRAIDLLRVAGEIAERGNLELITEKEVYKAKNQIELDCIREVLRTLPEQSKIVLLGIYFSAKDGRDDLTTGEVYDVYQQLCKSAGSSSLTQRRITDLISELDMLGIIHARIISKGKYGRTREIALSVPPREVWHVLSEDPALRDLPPPRVRVQSSITKF